MKILQFKEPLQKVPEVVHVEILDSRHQVKIEKVREGFKNVFYQDGIRREDPFHIIPWPKLEDAFQELRGIKRAHTGGY